jgi:hypothetical protein
MMINRQMEVWVEMGNGSRELLSERESLRVNRLYRKVEGVEGITWVLMKLYNVSWIAQKLQSGSRFGSIRGWVPV